MSKSSERLPYNKAEEEARAIKIMAEQTALNEGSLLGSKNRHFERSSQNLDEIREENPELADRLIQTAINAGELKEKNGLELFSLFEKVEDEVLRQMEKRYQSGESELKRKYPFNAQEFIIDFEKQMRSDERIARAFKGKEDLLDENMEFLKQQTPYLIKVLESYSE